MTPTAAQKALVEKIGRIHGPIIQNAFLQAIYTARANVDINALVDAIERNDFEAAVALLDLTPARFWALAEASRAAFLAAGVGMEELLPSKMSASFDFRGTHPRALAISQTHAAELVQGIVDDQIDAARLYLRDSLTGDRTARQIALDITGRLNPMTKRREGGIIGITSEQTDWTINARRQIQQLDPAYLKRKMRDKRLDATFRKALETGRPLPTASVDKMVARYKDNWLAYRGRLIAQNETFTAQSMGRHETMAQLLESGAASRVTKKWIHGHSKNPRPDHRALDGVVKDMAEDFVMSDQARLAMPHDPRGGAKHSAKCKCTVFYRPISEL